MRTLKLQFERNEAGRYVAELILPSRVNVYARLSKQGSIKVFSMPDGMSRPVEVGTSEYGETAVLDINLIAGTKVRLQSWSEIEEAVCVSEEG